MARTIQEIFEIREIIECGSAKRVALLEDKVELKKKIDEFEIVYKKREKTADESSDVNFCNDIHIIIIDVLGNKQLSRMYRELLDRIEMIRNHFGKRFNEGRINAIYDEHQEIINALISGDAERAEKMVQNHLNSASNYLIGLTVRK